jgi:hypothetical protein
MTFDPKTLLGHYTLDELEAAFTLVSSGMANWKLPINAVLPKMAASEAAKLAFAIGFYTGSEATFTSLPGGQSVLVTAPGYYRAVGA